MPNRQPLHEAIRVAADPLTVLQRIVQQALVLLPQVPDYAALLAVLQPLRAQGMRLSVDDAGSGYAGLSHILQLQPDVIKLDRSLIVGMHADPVRRALATAMACFAGSIGVEIIAEGLERQDDVDCLRQLGIRQVQGFLFWRPMPLAELVACAAGSDRG